MRKSNVLLLICYGILLFFNRCSQPPNKIPLDEMVSRFINQTDSIIGYGAIDINTLAQKADIESIPTMGKAAAQLLKTIKKGVRLSSTIYFALRGENIDSLSQPKFTYIFVDIKDADDFQSLFEGMGYQFNNKNGIRLASDNTTAIGITEKRAVLLMGKNNNAHTLINKIEAAFNSFKVKKIPPLAKEIFHQKADFIFAFNLNKSMIKSGVSACGLPTNFVRHLPSHSKNNPIVFSLNFEQGKLVSTLDLSHLQDSLSRLLFLDTSAASPVLNHLGGKPVSAALAISLNVKKLDNLLGLFSSDHSLSFLRKWGKIGVILEGLANGNLQHLIRGKMGIMVPKDQPKNLRFYAQLGKEKQNIIDLLHTFAKADTVKEISPLLFRYHHSLLKIDQSGSFIYQSIGQKKSDLHVGALQLDSTIPHFGATPLALFIDMQTMKKSIPLLKSFSSFLEGSKFLYLRGNNKKITLTLSFTDKKKNAIRQIIDGYMKNFSPKSLNLSF